ncbi:AraC family transcriptional regulator [Paenibacillus sp. GYB004]|uniref:AraC family transcriptional regulator n=1 Tax=Paenibacillus sp. GYB004 TaxID=2994393 RepID=UPI002F96420E
MDVSLLSPYIRTALDHTAPAGWVLHERVLFDYELLYVKEGHIIVTVGDTTYEGVPGDIFLFRPRERHSIRLAPGCPALRQPHIHFDLIERPDSPEVKISFKPMDQMNEQELRWFRDDVLSSPPMQIPSRVRLRSSALFESMLLGIVDEYERKLPFYETNVKGMFIQLWTLLLRELYWQEHEHVLTNMEALQAAKLHIARNLDRRLSVDELAAASNMSKYYFIRSFKGAFGVPPMKYYQIKRIEKAKELIQFTTLPVTEIAQRLGFPGIHAFSRAFRKAEGVAPTYYRGKDR